MLALLLFYVSSNVLSARLACSESYCIQPALLRLKSGGCGKFHQANNYLVLPSSTDEAILDVGFVYGR